MSDRFIHASLRRLVAATGTAGALLFVGSAQLAYSDPTANPAMQAQETEVEGDRAKLRSDQMPAIEEIGVSAPRFREDELIGTYAQPRWTATRLMPSTRIYVIPEGKTDVELWYRPTFFTTALQLKVETKERARTRN